MSRAAFLALALALTWLVWSGLFKPLLLALGVASVALCVFLSVRMTLTEREVFTLDLVPRVLGYWAWLAAEVVRSNLTVTRIVLSPRMPISPTLVRLSAKDLGRIGRATLANSITLTPGTLTVDSHAGELLVHSLTRKGAEELKTAGFEERISRALGDR